MSLGQSHGAANFFIGRPNLLRVKLSGSDFSYLIVSDGKVLTIYDGKKRKYTRHGAPEKPIQAANLFTGLAVFESQVLRFFGVVDDLANGNLSAKINLSGTERIGYQCDRYIIEYTAGTISDEWEVWLQQKNIPLPCRLL